MARGRSLRNTVLAGCGVGAKLLESYIREAETAEEFNVLLGDAFGAERIHPDTYQRCRVAVLAGCGVGKDLIQTYVPDASKSAGVVSTVLEALTRSGNTVSRPPKPDCSGA